MDNKTIIQYFEWYLPSDGLLWKKVAAQAPELAKVGITDVWLPPAYKGASGAKSVGYDVYDLFDLGEFDQRGSVRTKYGTKEEYLAAVKALHDAGIRVMADTVLNQMMGADETEKIEAINTAAYDREQEISGLHEIEAWTKFTFPGRNGTYSERVWTAENFSGTDLDQATGERGVFLFSGKHWSDETDSENVNYDYLMGVDLDFDNPDTCQALLDWGKWYFETVQPDALRLDAVKHISFESYREWLKLIRRETGNNFFAVGEYWSGDVDKLLHYIDVVEDGAPSRIPEKKAEQLSAAEMEEKQGHEPGDGQDSPEADAAAENSGADAASENSGSDASARNTEAKSPAVLSKGIFTEEARLSAHAYHVFNAVRTRHARITKPQPEEEVSQEPVSKEALKIADAGNADQKSNRKTRGTQIALFDVPLHFAFLSAATSNGMFDMRTLFDGTLVQARPECAVTFVDNHDTQPGQSLDSYVPEWFKPIAYSMLLLRDTGIPCVFYGDYYGLEQNNESPILDLKKLIAIRRYYAYGSQTDYFDDCNIVGFTRSGDRAHPHSGLAVLATNGGEGTKYMTVGAKYAGRNFYDVLGRHDDPITLDENGGAQFHVHGGYVSVWMPEEAYRHIRTDYE